MNIYLVIFIAKYCIQVYIKLIGFYNSNILDFFNRKVPIYNSKKLFIIV